MPNNPAFNALRRVVNKSIANGAPIVTEMPVMPQKIHAGYRAFTGYVFTESQAAAYNAAVERAERCPNEANRNGAHNLFNSIAMTPNRKRIERQAVGGWIRETGETVTALDAYANRRAELPRDRAMALLAEFDAAWPNADNLDAARHLIANA